MENEAWNCMQKGVDKNPPHDNGCPGPYAESTSEIAYWQNNSIRLTDIGQVVMEFCKGYTIY